MGANRSRNRDMDQDPLFPVVLLCTGPDPMQCKQAIRKYAILVTRHCTTNVETAFVLIPSRKCEIVPAKPVAPSGFRCNHVLVLT